MNTTNHGTKPLKEAGCEDPCSFCIRSREDDEVLRTFVAHVKQYHGLDLPRGEAAKAIHLVATV